MTVLGRFSTDNRASAATTWEDTGGAGGADQNIEIVTAADNVGEYTGYSYSFSMDFGAGKFEYRFGGDPARVVAS